MNNSRRAFFKKKAGGSPSFISDTSVDGFGFLNFYGIQDPGIRLRLATLDTIQNINWDGSYLNQSSIESFISGTPSENLSDVLYAQKNVQASLRLPSTGANSVKPKFLKDEFGPGKHAFSIEDAEGIGTFGADGSAVGIARNIDYLAVTVLVNPIATTRSTRQNIVHFSRNDGGVRAGLFFNSNNESGYRIGGRRLDSDSFQEYTISVASNGWQVLTCIWEYKNALIKLRKNGSQIFSNSFKTAGFTSDTNGALIFGKASTHPTNFKGASLVVWNSEPAISEIETIENQMMIYAGLI